MEGMQLVKVDYSTSDIIQAILKTDGLYHTDTANIAKTLRRPTHRQTVRAVFDYLLANVRYKLDKAGVQLAQRPKRTMVVKTGDCKSFSLLAGSLLYNLGYDYSYRFASYRIDPTPTHVYVIAHTPDGDIIVDGVLKKFDQEKKPITNQIDKRMKGLYIGSIGCIRTKPRRRVSTVAINGLDGIGKFSLRKTFNSVTQGASTVVRKVAKGASTVVRKVAKGAGTVVKKVAKGAITLAKKGFALLKKGYLAGPRNAFLLLVKINFRGYATRLSKSNRGELENTWEKIGGSRASLRSTIDDAKDKKRILGIGSVVYVPLSGICAIGEAITVGSAIASAASIIALLSKFLGKESNGGSPTEGLPAEGLAQAEEVSSQLESNSIAPPSQREPSTLETGSGKKVNIPNQEETTGSESGGNSGSDSGMSNTTKIALGVAAAGTVLFLAKGKRK